MANKTPSSIADQIALLKQRGLLFNDEQSAHHFLENINYHFIRHIAKSRLLKLRNFFIYLVMEVMIFRRNITFLLV